MKIQFTFEYTEYKQSKLATFISMIQSGFTGFLAWMGLFMLPFMIVCGICSQYGTAEIGALIVGIIFVLSYIIIKLIDTDSIAYPSEKDTDIFTPFVNQINLILGENLKYACVVQIKEDLINMLKIAQEESPEGFAQFAKSTFYHKWALAQISSLIFDKIATGEYHLFDSLNAEGQILTAIYRNCLNEALRYQYINETTWKNQIENFHQQIVETGKWA